MGKIDPQIIKKLILKHSEYGVIGLLLLITIIMFALLGRGVTIDIPPPQPIDTSQIVYPDVQVRELERVLEALEPFNQSDFQTALLQRNLFSFRDVLSRQAIEQEITEKLRRAQTLFEQGAYQNVIQLCDEILQMDPNRQPAIQLKESAQNALQSPTPPASPTG